MKVRTTKAYRRLNCSSVQVMLNHTAVNDSKGEPFPLDFNSQNANHTIQVY